MYWGIGSPCTAFAPVTPRPLRFGHLGSKSAGLRRHPGMTLSHSIFLPTGFGGPLPTEDPLEAYAALSAIAGTAERSGFETAWVLDHLQALPQSTAPVFECWALVAALLRDTTTLRVGNLVTAEAYRHPVLQAKIAGTTDVLSRGRLTFGIGAGWYEPDFAALGSRCRRPPSACAGWTRRCRSSTRCSPRR